MRKRVALGMTIQLGDYEPIRVDTFSEADSMEGESGEELTGRLAAEVIKDLTALVKGATIELTKLKEEAKADLADLYE